MTTETLIRAAFWILFAGVIVMRLFFAVQVRRAGDTLYQTDPATYQAAYDSARAALARKE